MQIVIDIDNDIAHGIIDGQNDEPRDIVRGFQATIADAIKNGTLLKVGHWIKEFNDAEGEVRFVCSNCKKYQLFKTDYCYHCGSDNRKVKK
jgi:hypothetical protein